MPLIIKFLISIFLIALSAFCSGSETGVYSLSKLKLRVGTKNKRPFHRLLASLIKDSQGLIFSILIGNNLATYFATSMVTIIVMSFQIETNHAEYYSTLIIAPVLFVFGEVIPKTIYYYHSDSIMPGLSPLLWLMHKIFSWTGLVWALKSITRILERITHVSEYKSATSKAIVRKHIDGILQDTKDEGYLSHIQDDILRRVVNIFDIRLTSVMVPISKVVAVDINSDREKILTILKASPYTQILVYETNINNILGYVNIYKVLNDKDSFDLKRHLNDIRKFTPATPVIRALNKMHHGNIKIALISREKRGVRIPLGIVTIKDLAEEITGELAVC